MFKLQGLLLASLILVSHPSGIPAAEGGTPAALPADPAVVVTDIDGRSHPGVLTALDDRSLSLRDASETTTSWSLSDIRALKVDSVPQALEEAPPLVLLANDDTLSGAVTSADEDTLTVQWTAVDPPQALTLPLDAVRSFVFQQPEDEVERARFVRIWALLEPRADRLISTDNTHVDGELLGIADGRLRLKASLGEFTAPLSEVIAVVMNSELVSTSRPEGAYALASFRDGSRLTLTSLRAKSGAEVSARTAWGAEIAFALERISRLQFFGDRVTAVSDLTPAKYEFTPYLTQQFPLVTNRNVKGGRLRLRGDWFASGLGVSTRSEVTYDLKDREYAAFEAVVGVDDMTGGHGNVVFAVEIDGNRIYESAPLTGKSPQAAIGPFDVAGAGQLKLITDFGEQANIQDVADWCDPVLIKASGGRQSPDVSSDALRLDDDR